MKIYRASCIDTDTKMEIIASHVSYNNACSFLEQRLGMDNFIEVKRKSLNETWLVFSTRRFLYDEIRGLLLGE